jgi:hypothetical protein
MQVRPLERGDRAPHLAGMTGDVDHGVERFARQWLETAWSIAIDAHEARAGCNRTRQAARGAGHLVPDGAGLGRDRASEKLAPAQDQQPHGTPLPE